MAPTTKTTVADYERYALQVAKLSLANAAIFAPQGIAFNNDILDIVDKRTGNSLTATFGEWGTLTAQDVGEGVEYQGYAPMTLSTTDITATRSVVGTEITWEADKVAADELQMWVNAGAVLGQSMAKKFNEDICALFDSFTTEVGSTGTNIDNADIQSGIAALQLANVPGQYACVLHGQQWYDLISESSSPLTDASKTQKAEQFYNGWFIDDIYGLNWFITNGVQTANAGADRAGAMFGPGAIGVVWGQDFTLEKEWNKDKGLWELLLSTRYGVGIADDDRGVAVVTDA